jgi:integrase
MTQSKTTLPDGFNLYKRLNGQYAKRIRGKLYCFGKVSDPVAAWQKYNEQRGDLEAGRVPRAKGESSQVEPELHDLVNQFLAHKEAMVEANELSARMYADYHGICERLVTAFGRDRVLTDLRADDFEKLRTILSKGKNGAVGPVTLCNLIRLVRVVFKYGYDSDLLKLPVKMGPGFKMPRQKVLRRERNSKKLRLFEADELRLALDAAKQPMRAMILLGINCGLGNTDCSTMPISATETEADWLVYPRPKTEVKRRCPLWPETIKAVREAIAARQDPKRDEFAGLAFLTKFGAPYVRNGTTGSVREATETNQNQSRKSRVLRFEAYVRDHWRRCTRSRGVEVAYGAC